MSGSGMIDTGFADNNLVRLTLRAIRVKAAVAQARASVEALAYLLDQQREPLARDGAAPLAEGFDLAAGNCERGVEGAAISGAERDALREHELLEGVKLIAQLLDRVDVGIRHGLFSSSDGMRSNPGADGAHRLSGGAK